MTQDEFIEQLAIVYDAFNTIAYNSKLLDIAAELSDKHSTDNFDKVSLLIDCFKSRLEGDLDNLQVTLHRIKAYVESIRDL